MMGEKEALLAAVERLYEVFARCRVGQTMVHCEHCVSEKEIEKLLGVVNLREVAQKHLQRYAWKAMTTWGTVEDFKHFLPRIFELISIERAVGFEKVVIGGKLVHGRFETWPKVQYDAINEFMLSWWRYELTHLGAEGEEDKDDRHCLDECLECVASVYKDVSAFLDIWRDDYSVSAIRQLCFYIELVYIGAVCNRVFELPFGGDAKVVEQVKAFLLEDCALQKIEQAFFEHSDAPYAYEFSEGFEKLEEIRRVLKGEEKMLD